MSSSAYQGPLFSLLPETRKPWAEFVFGSGTQALAIAFLIWVRLLHPSVFSPPEHIYRSLGIVTTPQPVNHQPQRLKPALVAQLNTPQSTFRLPAPQQKTLTRAEEVAAPVVNIAL